MPYLNYKTAYDAGRLELSEAEMTIGRWSGNHLELAEHFCSRIHLLLTRDANGGYWLEAVPPATRNQTVLNGALLTPGDRRPLCDGDVLQIGGSLLTYHA